MIGTFLLATVVLANQLAEGDSTSMITPGVFHKGEVKAQDGEQWLGLAQEGAGFAWRTFRVDVSTVEDPLVDQSGEKTGSEVNVSGGSPIFLLRGADLLIGKTVRTARFDPGGIALKDLGQLTLQCQGCRGSYRLGVSKGTRLVLVRNGVAQTLYEWPSGLDDQHCELIWAGDLDGDGDLDLYMNLSGHYNVTEATLFLSSQRGPGKLVERAAVFSTVGC